MSDSLDNIIKTCPAEPSRIEIAEGGSYEVAHPFIRTTYTDFDDNGPFEAKTWAPGVRMEHVYPDDSEAVADGLGAQLFSVVSVHKPGRYPTRVFYTRQWRDPQGKVFGNHALRMKTLGSFRNMLAGYRHDFRLVSAETVEA